MKYLLLIAFEEANWAAMSDAQKAEGSAAYGAYTEAMAKAGVLLGGERLKPTSTATSVRVRNGKTEVLNGPYAETREQLGGYYVIEASDLDAALSWAARCPGASHGTMEVRPIWPMM
jgi:hypothetical protein